MRKGFAYLYLGLDFLVATIIWFVFYNLRHVLLNEPIFDFDLKLLIGLVLIPFYWTFIYAMAGTYYNIFSQPRAREVLNLIPLTFGGSVFIFFTLLLDDHVLVYTSYYKLFFTYWGLHYTITVVFKMFFLGYLRAQIKKGNVFFNTLIIGGNDSTADVVEELKNSFLNLGLRFVAYVNNTPTESLNKLEIKYLGGLENIEKVIRRCKIEQVIVACEPNQHEEIRQILILLEGYNLKIHILPDLYQILLGTVKINHVLGVPIIEFKTSHVPVWQTVLKRIFDISMAVFVMLIGCPFFLLFCILTKFSSEGPIFFFQERIGRSGLPFKIIKFRSMFVNAEKMGPALSSDNDPRITKWGKVMRKTRIDELPQFFNVFKGDMSIVGPRPERRFYIDQIVKVAPHYRYLHKVRPGITSLGQVKYGYAENVEQMVKRLKYDILYIENMSFTLDIRIILYTVVVMVQGRGK